MVWNPAGTPGAFVARTALLGAALFGAAFFAAALFGAAFFGAAFFAAEPRFAVVFFAFPPRFAVAMSPPGSGRPEENAVARASSSEGCAIIPAWTSRPSRS